MLCEVSPFINFFDISLINCDWIWKLYNNLNLIGPILKFLKGKVQWTFQESKKLFSSNCSQQQVGILNVPYCESL